MVRSGCAIYRGSVIGDRLETGHYVVIREENKIGDDFSIWSHSVIDYACDIGDRVKIHTGVYIAQYSVIGNDAFIGPGAVFTNDLVPGQKVSADALGGPRIGRSAQIGARAVLLPNVEIGDDALVGAGSVVTTNVPAGMVVAGNPAKVIGSVADLQDRLQREGVWMPRDAD
jgi:acetyltransferase-like isoleucine patch superfamily enzyme